jgi:two-component system cell cycle response regulator
LNSNHLFMIHLGYGRREKMRRVLVVNDDREIAGALSQYLTEDGYTIQIAPDSEGALHRLRAWKPHLVLLDVKLPKMSELDLISKIRMHTPDEYSSIILTFDEMSIENLTKCIEAGADDFLIKPIRQIDLIPRVRSMLKMKEVHDSLRRASHRIEELTSTDDLTGLMNMRAVFRKGEEEIGRSNRFRKPVSSILLNLDGFTQVNQNHGFMIGSHILQEVAVRIRQCLRSVDLVARVGADEFFILLGETDLGNAEFIAERIRDSIQSSAFKNEKQSVNITATLGVAGFTPDQTNQRMTDLLHLTTEALKSAKANGANRIEVYSFT